MLFLRKKASPTTDTVEIAMETKIKETPSKSDTIIEVVKTAIKSWRIEARRLGLPQRDIDMFAPRFDKWIDI